MRLKKLIVGILTAVLMGSSVPQISWSESPVRGIDVVPTLATPVGAIGQLSPPQQLDFAAGIQYFSQHPAELQTLLGAQIAPRQEASRLSLTHPAAAIAWALSEPDQRFPQLAQSLTAIDRQHASNKGYLAADALGQLIGTIQSEPALQELKATVVQFNKSSVAFDGAENHAQAVEIGETGQADISRQQPEQARLHKPQPDPVYGATNLNLSQRHAERVILPEAEFRRLSEQSWGRILSDSELPQLREVLVAPISRLHEALKDVSKERIGTRLDMPVGLWIHDSPRINAYMNVVETPSGEKKAVWTMTTGLIKEFFDAFPGDPNRAMKALVGVMAHEISHTLDVFDPRGIEQTYRYKEPEPILNSGVKIENPNQDFQAIELRTDVEAVNLLREAGLPDDALLEGLTALQRANDRDPKNRDLNPLFTYFSSHPDDQMRLSAQRIALTTLRYMRGDKPVVKDGIPPGLSDEIKTLHPAVIEAPAKTMPDGVLETIAEIEKILGMPEDQVSSWMSDIGGAAHTTDSNGRTIRYGYLRSVGELVLHLDQLLIERGTALTASEKEAVIAFNLKIVDPNSDAGISDWEDHRRLMARIPLYRSAEYKSALKQAATRFLKFKKVQKPDVDKDDFPSHIPSRDPRLGGIRALQVGLRRFSDATSPDILVEVTQEALAGSLAAWMEDEPDQSTFKGLGEFSGDFLGYGDRFAPFFHERVLPKVSARARANWWAVYLATEGDGKFSPLNFRYPASARSPKAMRAALEKDQRALMARLSPDLKIHYKAIASRLWKDRARLAVLDLITSRHTHWPLAYELLGIPAEQGDASLNAAVKKFALSPGYAPYLKSLVRAGLAQRWEPNYAEPAWAADDLFEYLTGRKSPGIVPGELEEKVARILVAGGYLDKKQRLLRKMYGERLAKALAASGTGPISIEDLERINTEALDGLQGRGGRWEEAGKALDVLAQALNESALVNKKDLLREVFVEMQEPGEGGFPISASWYNDHSGGRLLSNAKRVIEELLSAGVVGSYAEFLSRVVFSPERAKHPFVSADMNLEVIVALKGELLQELAKVSQGKGLSPSFDELVEATLGQAARIDLADKKYEYAKERISAQISSPEWYELKNAFAQALLSVPMDAQAKLKAFETITATGGTPETDEVFKTGLHHRVRSSPEALTALVKSKAIASGTLKVALAREILEPQLEALERGTVAKNQYQKLLSDLHDLVPHDSSSRDQFIEDTLWRLRIEDPEIVELAQGAKSSNWRKANPQAIQWLSTHQWLTQDLTPDQRLILADYLADPRGQSFPAEIEAAFDKRFAELQENGGGLGGSKDVASARERYRLAGKLQIQAFAREATPNEKIPAIELLLTGGQRPLVDQPGFSLRLMRERLGYAPGSIREKVFLAYLNSLPAKERSVTLAFMLSRKGEEGAGLKPIFEVFQTVGIKAGQLGALWKLFGSQASDELKELKDKASPIEKAEILQIMRATLSPEEAARISHLEAILGSASVKAVVLVRLRDGSQAVMMVRRPHAEEQIRSNLGRARAFLAELEKLGVEFDYRAMHSMLDTVEEQLADELRFTQEAEKIVQAKVVFEQLNREMGKELHGWRFSVPQLLPGFEIRDHLLFMEKAGGATLNQSPASAVKRFASRLILGASFRSLFRHGWFNADGHAGNWLMDAETKTIYPIDFGQAESFSRSASWLRGDELYHVAQFLRASLSRNKKAVILHGLALSDPRRLNGEQLRQLDRSIGEVMARDIQFEDRTLALVSAFSESGIKIKRKVSFGALKGLVTLEQEGYVPASEFTKRIRREITRILARKFPALLNDAVRSFFGPAFGGGK